MEDAKRPLSCDQAVKQFFAYLDRALSGEPMEALEAHLEACLDCCERLEFSRKLDAFVKHRLRAAPLPDGIEERIRRELDRRG
ncbi:MAG: anti-sigma factor family protein [Candidatus Rokuibacteriota bacterium]